MVRIRDTGLTAETLTHALGEKGMIIRGDFLRDYVRISVGTMQENRRLIEEGAIDFIISQNTEKQGYMGINTLYRHLVLKEPCISEILMPINIVMAENLSNYQ